MSFSWNLPNTGIEPVSLMSPELAGGFFTTSTIWEALLIVSYIYLFQKCHLVGIIQYVEFSELKFMFQTFDSCTHLNLFTHLALHIDVSSVSFHVLVLSFLLLPDNIPLDWCFTVYWFSYRRHLGYFQFLAIINKASLKIHI